MSYLGLALDRQWPILTNRTPGRVMSNVNTVRDFPFPGVPFKASCCCWIQVATISEKKGKKILFRKTNI